MHAAIKGMHRFHKLTQESHRVGTLARGTILFREGDEPTTVYYIESGLLKISRRFVDDRSILIRLVRRQELAGEGAVIFDGPRTCTAQVLTDCVAYQYTRKQFLELCRRDVELWRWVAQTAGKRTAELERRMQLISFCRVEHRLLLSLADLAKWFSEDSEPDGEIAIPLAQSELANLIGATRETTSTTLNTLERRGLIHLRRRYLLIPDEQALRTAAADSGLV